MFGIRRKRSQSTKKTPKKRRKVGGKRVKTPIEKPPKRECDTKKIAVPKQRSIVRKKKPVAKRTSVTSMDVAKAMGNKKGGKKK